MSGQTAPPLSLITQIPASLIELLTRELAFKRAREQLVHALEETRTHQKIAQTTRPPFLMLHRARVREEIKSNLIAANQSVELLERGVAKLDRSEHQLQSLIAQRIENHLRNRSDDYINSLISYYHVEDWQRLQARIELCTSELQDSLAKMVRACEEMPRHSAITLKERCGVLLQSALRAALQFEREIHFTNRISDRQNQLSGLAGATLPRQIALDWSGALHEIEQEQVGAALNSLIQLAAKHDEVSQQALDALQTEASPAHFAANTEALSFQAKQWAIMRKAVIERVNSANFEAIAEETECFLETGQIAKLALTEDDVVKVKSEAPPPPGLRPPAKQETAPPVVTPQVPNPPPVSSPKEAPSLRLRARQPKSPPSPPLQPSLDELNSMHQDLEQARALLREEKSQLQARAQFLAESEAHLRASIQDHQEREALLEQRAENLRVLQHTNLSPAL